MSKYAICDAGEVAEKLGIIAEHCDIWISENATLGDLSNFFERCSLDSDGNVWFTERGTDFVNKRIINADRFGTLVIKGAKDV